MHLFIDTNIYLNFYHYSSDDLEELKKLIVAIDNHKISLYVTDQVKDEFRRKRETKIADALKNIDQHKLGGQFPQMCKEYPEYLELNDAMRTYELKKNYLTQKLMSAIASNSLGADEILNELFAKAKRIKSNEKIHNSARLRVEIGNPPGKNGSLGDAINWESLLVSVPDEELFLVTDDKDYISPVDTTKPAEFLLDEWDRKKNRGVFLYRKLSDFFIDKFPTIKLASEMEKSIVISELENSGNYVRTHSVIAKLSKFSDFTNAEVNAIVETAITNSQVFGIAADEDVSSFMAGLTHGKDSVIEPSRLVTFKALFR
jgi:predicted nucleic acid-binding protein